MFGQINAQMDGGDLLLLCGFLYVCLICVGGGGGRVLLCCAFVFRFFVLFHFSFCPDPFKIRRLHSFSRFISSFLFVSCWLMCRGVGMGS